MSETFLGISVILGLILLLAAGMPVAFALGITGAAGMILLTGMGNAINLLGIFAYNAADNFIFTTLPLYVLMAEITLFSGITDNMYDSVNKWLVHLPGGLAVASNVGAGIFAAICGGSTATAAAIGTIAIPQMMKRGYNKTLAAGSVAAGGTVGILIPPSIPMILYSFISDASIGKLFIAGIIPGVMQVLIYSSAIILLCAIKPNLAPRASKVSWTEKFSSLRKIWAMLLLIALVIGSMYMGIATPTESAAIGCFGALIIAVATRRLTLKSFTAALFAAARTSCFVMMILIGATMFGNVLTQLMIPQSVVQIVTTMQLSSLGILLISILVLLLMGMFMDIPPIIFITMPIIIPVVNSVGIDLVWFGIIVVIVLEMGMLTPPVGLNCFVIKGVCDPYGVSLGTVFKGVSYFLPLDIVRLALVIGFPALALWLPSTMRQPIL